MFIDEYLTGFYEPHSGTTHEFGNIYQTHAYYPHENLQFFRPAQFLNPATATHATRFSIQTSRPFGHGHTLASPPLQSNEELLVIRAKIRPVVLLRPQAPIDGIQKTISPIWRKRCLIGQIFSINNTTTNQLKFPQTFIDRVRELEFPHLCFLPAGGPLHVDSILRLDECQSVFTPHLSVTGYKLSEEMRDLLLSQFTSFFEDKPSGFYEMYRRDILQQKAKKLIK